ncbi:MAG: hypothetical protein EU530_00785 [Promethearchaeota archaeon]|nr:MAG: hypothetical protein EU530_00785 [Candidatus Lokiarchaeota archaeon]
MVYINPVEQFTLIVKIINITFFVVLAFAVLRQKKDYIVNKMYFAAFLCWVGYIGMDAVIFVFLPVSPTWYFIGNRMRDVGVLSVMAVAFLIYKSLEIINKGIDSLNKPRLYFEMAIFVIIGGLLVWVDSVEVYVWSSGEIILPENLPPSGTDFITQPNVGIFTLILSAVPFILFAYTVIRLMILTRKVTKPNLKHRMRLLTAGVAFIPIGMLYFILVSMVPIYAWWSSGIGYTLWTTAPILIWLSRRKSKEEREEKINQIN